MHFQASWYVSYHLMSSAFVISQAFIHFCWLWVGAVGFSATSLEYASRVALCVDINLVEKFSYSGLLFTKLHLCVFQVDLIADIRP